MQRYIFSIKQQKKYKKSATGKAIRGWDEVLNEFNITSKKHFRNQMKTNQTRDHLLLNSYSSPYQHLLNTYKRKS